MQSKLSQGAEVLPFVSAFDLFRESVLGGVNLRNPEKTCAAYINRQATGELQTDSDLENAPVHDDKGKQSAQGL